MIYVIVLTFQYLTGFSDIRLSGVEEHQELSYIKNIKNSFIQTLNTSNISNNGDMNKMVKDIDFTKNFFKQELLKKGIDFDSKFIIFSNGFETGDLSKWDGIGCTGVDFCPNVVNYAYDGSFSLYCDNVEYVYKKLSGMNEVYARVYVNFKTLPLNPYMHYFIDFYDDGNQILGLGLWNDNNVYKLRAYSTSINKNWNSTISIGENEWHYFELYWYENGTNSKIKAWYDGDLKIDQADNSDGKGKSIDEYRFGAVDIGGGSTTPDLFVDCAAISSDYVGDKCFPDEQNYFDFTLKTNGMHTETEFPYQEKIVPNPVWFNNFVNNTVAGQPTLFSLNWTDVVDLSGYIFSFDNCTGSFTNDAWVPMTGLNNWSSVIKAISPIVGCTIRWQVYANDTSGKWNTSYIFSLTTTGTPLLIQFVSPTDNNGATVSRNWSYVNVSITDALNTSSFIDWNRNLVGYWSMDSYNSSGVFDNSTWNNFGTFNGVTSSNITTGKYGYGLNFNGVQWGNNYINAGNPSCLNLSSTGTLEAWIYHKIYGSANYDVFIGKDDWPSDRNGYNFMIKSDYKLGGQIANATNENYISGNTVIQNYTWYHVAFVWNSTHMILYVNGKVDNTAPQTLIPKSDVYDLWIGGSPSWGASFFNGTIDEVKIWNRALSPEEINASYNSGLYNLYHNFTNLTNGTYQYYAYAIDTAGNNNKTETRTLTVNTQAPQQAPQYFNNFVNNTIAGKSTLFSLNWTDDVGLSGYIFRTNNTGTWQNDTWKDFENQTGNAIFFDSFESEDFSKWDSVENVSVTSAKSHHGAYSAYIDPTIDSRSRMFHTFANGYNVLYYRTYWQTDTLTTGSNAHQIMALWDSYWGNLVMGLNLQYVYDNGNYWRLVAYWYNQSGIPVSAYSSYITISANQWHSFEIKYTNDSSSSTAIQVWYDGVNVINGTNSYGVRLDTAMVGTSYTDQPNAHNWADQVVVSTSYIGPDTGWSNVTKTLNSTVGIPIGWCVYANDTSNNWNSTSCNNPFSFTTSGSTTDNVLNIHFNEANGTVVHDSSSYHNDGTFYGETFNDGTSYSGSSPTDLHTSSGKYGKALSFDGSDDYVSIPDSSSLDVINFTAAFWVKWKGSTNYWNRILNKKLNWNDPDGWDINLVEPGTMTGGIEIEGSGSSSTTIKCVDDWRTTDLNVWHHIAVIINGSTAYLYCDGSYKGSGAIPSIVANNRPLYIGRIETETDWFNGTIDEVRIWNRSLSQAEINAEMQSSLPVVRPVAVWSFEEPSNARYVNDTHIWVKGNMSSALSFDGLDDLVNVSDSNSLDVSNITIAAWIYPYNWDGIEGGDYGRIVDKSGAYLFFLAKDGTFNRLSFYYWNSSGFSNQSWSNTNSIQLNKWQHVAVTYNGTHSTFYVNGIFNSTTYHPLALGPIRATTNGLYVGNNDDDDREFNGIIDELRIWNKSLSQAEIQTEMSKG
jgi:hypothetical protein